MNISVIYRIYHRSCDFSTKPAWGCSNGLVGAQLYAKPDGWIAEEDRFLRRSSVAEALEDSGSRSSTPNGACATTGNPPRGREITRKSPPSVRFFTKIRTKITIEEKKGELYPDLYLMRPA